MSSQPAVEPNDPIEAILAWGMALVAALFAALVIFGTISSHVETNFLEHAGFTNVKVNLVLESATVSVGDCGLSLIMDHDGGWIYGNSHVAVTTAAAFKQSKPGELDYCH